MSYKIHADYDKVVTKKDLTKVFLREITYEHTWNYERMGNVGFCFSMYPVLKKLYPDKKDLAAAMKRHLTKACGHSGNRWHDRVFSFQLKEKTSPILIVIIILAILAVVAVILLLIIKKRRNSHSSK